MIMNRKKSTLPPELLKKSEKKPQTQKLGKLPPSTLQNRANYPLAGFDGGFGGGPHMSAGGPYMSVSSLSFSLHLSAGRRPHLPSPFATHASLHQSPVAAHASLRRSPPTPLADPRDASSRRQEKLHRRLGRSHHRPSAAAPPSHHELPRVDAGSAGRRGAPRARALHAPR